MAIGVTSIAAYSKRGLFPQLQFSLSSLGLPVTLDFTELPYWAVLFAWLFVSVTFAIVGWLRSIQLLPLLDSAVRRLTRQDRSEGGTGSGLLPNTVAAPGTAEIRSSNRRSILSVAVNFAIAALGLYVSKEIANVLFASDVLARWHSMAALGPMLPHQIHLDDLSQIDMAILSGFAAARASNVIEVIVRNLGHVVGALNLFQHEAQYRDVGRSLASPDIFFEREFPPTLQVNVYRTEDLAAYCREIPHGRQRRTLCKFHLPDPKHPSAKRLFDQVEMLSEIKRYFDRDTSEVLFLSGDRLFVAYCTVDELLETLDDYNAGSQLIVEMEQGDGAAIANRFRAPSKVLPSNYSALLTLVQSDFAETLIILDTHRHARGRVGIEILLDRLIVPKVVPAASKQLDKEEEDAPINPAGEIRHSTGN
ncbi:MAG: hypothetical protein WAW96_02000 [Alphaproteobacteria bacterium]